MALKGIGGVLEGGTSVPVGGEPGDADSDEDSESEDLHSANVLIKKLKMIFKGYLLYF